MDVGIRFWNNDWGLVETCYSDSQFLRHPNAEILLSCLTDSINHLDNGKLLQLAINGPGVNWLVLGMLDDKVEAYNFTRTLHVGSCAQRIIHGALKEGIHKTGWKLDKASSDYSMTLHLVEKLTELREILISFPQGLLCCCISVADSNSTRGTSGKCGSQ